MIIDEDSIIREGYGNENLALACLLAADVCFLNVVDLSKQHPEYFKELEWTTCVYVNCNDTFAYAAADGESISNNDGDLDSEIITLYTMWKENNNFGPVKWVSLKRGMRPLRELVERMKVANYWDDQLEALPEPKT